MININFCRLWESTILSNSGKFWRWAVLRVNPGLYPSQADDLLTSSILSKVPEIRIFPNTGPDIVESLLQVVSEGKAPKLKKITVSLATASLSQLSPEILAGAAVKLERFSARLSSVQNEAILTRSATTQDSRLRELSCYQMAEMPGMDPEILSQALVKLEIVGYRGFLVKLSPDQVLALFSRIRESPDLRLTELEIYLDVSMVPPELFAGALSRLETVRFRPWSRVTPSQLESLFMLMISNQQEEAGESKLKQLKFCGIDLTSVPPEVLVGAIQSLEKVEFWPGKMTMDQINAILTMLKGNQQGKLKYVVIDRPSILGGSVSPTLLRQARLNTSLEI